MKNEYSEMASHLVANTEWDLLRFEILGEPVPLFLDGTGKISQKGEN